MESRTNKTGDAAGSDLSELIKAATKDNHVKAENTQLMLNYQKGQITLTQYKLLLCSLYEIYVVMEEELDRNADHPAVQPIYFPQELSRREALERDLRHFFGPNWRSRITVPSATHTYTQRLREVGRSHPELLVAHAYTRYLGDLSGGQVLGKITQKALGLRDDAGLLFFQFPGVSSPNRFKQLYRSRMNSVELSETQRRAVLDEANAAFQLNIQVFDDLQKLLSITGETSETGRAEPSRFSSSPALQFALGVGITLATVGMGVYAL